MATHVIYSFEVGAPLDKITQRHEELLRDLYAIEVAENKERAPYAHYYEERYDEYDLLEYIYVETTNA